MNAPNTVLAFFSLSLFLSLFVLPLFFLFRLPFLFKLRTPSLCIHI